MQRWGCWVWHKPHSRLLPMPRPLRRIRVLSFKVGFPDRSWHLEGHLFLDLHLQPLQSPGSTLWTDVSGCVPACAAVAGSWGAVAVGLGVPFANMRILQKWGDPPWFTTKKIMNCHQFSGKMMINHRILEHPIIRHSHVNFIEDVIPKIRQLQVVDVGVGLWTTQLRSCITKCASRGARQLMVDPQRHQMSSAMQAKHHFLPVTSLGYTIKIIKRFTSHTYGRTFIIQVLPIRWCMAMVLVLCRLYCLSVCLYNP